MALDPLTAVLDVAQTVITRLFPDKSEQEKAQLTAAMAMIQGQMSIDQAEAQSTDPLQHWRGGLGWVCTAGYAWNFVGQPMTNAIGICVGHPLNLAMLDIGPLTTLTLGMLGLGGLHVAEIANRK